MKRTQYKNRDQQTKPTGQSWPTTPFENSFANTESHSFLYVCGHTTATELSHHDKDCTTLTTYKIYHLAFYITSLPTFI